MAYTKKNCEKLGIPYVEEGKGHEYTIEMRHADTNRLMCITTIVANTKAEALSYMCREYKKGMYTYRVI